MIDITTNITHTTTTDTIVIAIFTPLNLVGLFLIVFHTRFHESLVGVYPFFEFEQSFRDLTAILCYVELIVIDAGAVILAHY